MKKYFMIILCLSIISLLVAGCSPQEAPSQPQADDTPQPEQEVDTNMPVPDEEQPEPETEVVEDEPQEVAQPEETQAQESAVKDINIVASNWNFAQDDITIKKGDRVRLHLTSTEGVHGFFVPSLGLSSGKLNPGEDEIVVEFDANEVGTFDYFCNIPCGSGHKEMKGQIIVE